MRYKILVNAITSSRILLTIAMAYVILKHGNILILSTLLYMLICLTDHLDGRLARRFSAVSCKGAIFDVVADLFFITGITGTMIYLGIMPDWFLLVIGVKFVEFIGTSCYFRKTSSSEDVFISDKIGRSVAAMFYVMPYVSFIVFKIASVEWNIIIINTLCFIITALSMISSTFRVKSCLVLTENSKKIDIQTFVR